MNLLSWYFTSLMIFFHKFHGTSFDGCLFDQLWRMVMKVQVYLFLGDLWCSFVVTWRQWWSRADSTWKIQHLGWMLLLLLLPRGLQMRRRAWQGPWCDSEPEKQWSMSGDCFLQQASLESKEILQLSLNLSQWLVAYLDTAPCKPLHGAKVCRSRSHYQT